MIWVQHDLYKNFLKSFKIGDMNMSLDIFRSEISDLLTHKTDEFYSLLEKIKIKHNKKESFEELLDIVLREMKKNEKFVRGLAFLIGENNDVVGKNPKINWVKLIDGIKKGIEQIADYFEQNPRMEKLFRKKTLSMVELKSSVIGDITRPLNKKDNTVLWVFGLIAVGVAGYFIYKHFNKIKEDKLRAESLNIGKNTDISTDISKEIQPSIIENSNQVGNVMQNGGGLQQNNQVNKPIFDHINDPAYNVSTDVLLPETPVIQPIPQNQVANGIQIQVQPMHNNNSNLNNNLINQQKNVNIN